MKDTIIKEGPYRYDWKTREMVLIKGVTLEIGQLVTYHGYAMCTSKFVCISDPDSRGLQQLVEINGEHRRHTWDLSVNDRSTEQVFGIGLYYDPSPYRMPAEEIARHTRAADIQERWNARREANQKAADARECEQLRRQWAGILTPLADVEGWQEREKTEKANMLALLKHEYPGTRFSARKSRGGGYYTISWQDGPTEKAVEATCSVWHSYTFDCYTDYNEYTPSNFNKVFGGTEYRIDTNRTYSQPIQDAARADLLSICPEFADLLGTGELYRPEDAADIPQLWLNITVNRHPDNPTARAIEEAGWHAAAQFNQIRPDNILIAYLSTQDHTTPPDPPAGQKTDNPTDTTDNDQAPADGLQLVEIADGLAVTGDSRTTYRNRKAIKAHGAHWNKAAQQWQATTPEACAALRGWFAQNDTDTTTTTTPPQPLPEPPAAVIIDDTTDTTPANQKTDTDQPTTPDSQKAAALFELFESEISKALYTGAGFEKEPPHLWNSGNYYTNGKINDLFTAFRLGYKLAL